MARRQPIYSTRDLLLMAALAALGGVAGTYINAAGDAVQSVLGFAGSMQWAAGLHVLWLTLAVGLTGRLGAGTITGLLKGAVELLTGNTHGLLVVLIDLVAGVLVDLGFMPFRRKDSLLPFLLAGGLAAASNVFVFQLFAAVPADVLAYGAMALVAGMAFLSGALFAGGLGLLLLNTLRRAGVVKDRAPAPVGRRAAPLFAAGAVLIVVAFTLFLRGALRGPSTLHVGGAVDAAYDYPRQNGDIEALAAEGTLRGVSGRYNGVPVRELLARARPQSGAALLLVRGSDGYAFFISLDEVRDNSALLLAPKGEGQKATYDLVGARNSKAWVRGVTELVVIGPSTLEVSGALDGAGLYDPDDWQFDMDSARLDVGDGPHKYQGVPLGKVLAAMGPRPEAATVVVTGDGDPVSLPLAEVLGDTDLRLFTILGEADVSFSLARMDGRVLATRVRRVEVR